MYRLTHETPYLRTTEQRPNAFAVRTYRQIAEVLQEREGKPISEDRVAHICRSAELKIIDAIRADPVIGKRYAPT